MILKLNFETGLAYHDFLSQLNDNDNETVIFKKCGDVHTVFLYCKDITEFYCSQICKHFSYLSILKTSSICNGGNDIEHTIIWIGKDKISSYSATITQVPYYLSRRGTGCESLLYVLSAVNVLTKKVKEPKIRNVKFNDPATIVFWEDGTKTVVKAQDGEKFDKEKGLAMAIIKKSQDNSSKYYEIFKKYIKD